MTYKALHSELDAAVNFTCETYDGGMFEARYVRRQPSYITCYLSSHSGCVKGCRFCHLTQTGQTTFHHASENDFLTQARRVLDHYQITEGPTADIVYFSFMSRGEPLANRNLLKDGDEILTVLGNEALKYHGLASRYCISTIMPVEVRNRELIDIFAYTRPVFYYSLYSLDPAFRAKWLPQAMDPVKALEKFAVWQDQTMMSIKIHGAVIKGENDSFQNWEDICGLIRDIGLKYVEFNLIPYNPFTPDLGEPVSEFWMSMLQSRIERYGFSCQVKKRVGFDIKASCGMFINNSKEGRAE